MESVYAGKGKKKENEMKEIVNNFQEITERKDAVRKKVKKANDALKAARNAEAVRRNSENSTRRCREERGDGSRPGGAEKQFKQPTGVLPTKISEDNTPIFAQGWANDMKLYLRTCLNLDILS